MAVFRIVGRDEVVEIGAFKRIFFQGEVFVGASWRAVAIRRRKIVNPGASYARAARTPGFPGGGFAIEEDDVGLEASPARTALGVEDADGQTQQGVNVGLLE